MQCTHYGNSVRPSVRLRDPVRQCDLAFSTDDLRIIGPGKGSRFNVDVVRADEGTLSEAAKMLNESLFYDEEWHVIIVLNASGSSSAFSFYFHQDSATDLRSRLVKAIIERFKDTLPIDMRDQFDPRLRDGRIFVDNELLFSIFVDRDLHETTVRVGDVQAFNRASLDVSTIRSYICKKRAEWRL